jgi:hypothetical protein
LKNLLSLINNEGSDFLFPMDQIIIENIERVIEEDGFWLKLYHIDIKRLNILIDQWFERKKLINKLF